MKDDNDMSMEEFLGGRPEEKPGVTSVKVTKVSMVPDSGKPSVPDDGMPPEGEPPEGEPPMSPPGPADVCPMMEYALMALSAESSIHLFHTMVRNINLHELAGEIYESFDTFYDDLSEQLVSLGYEVPPSLQEYENGAPGSAGELAEFIRAFAAGVAENAEKFGDEGVTNVCAGFCEKLNKYVYKLTRFFEGE